MHDNRPVTPDHTTLDGRMEQTEREIQSILEKYNSGEKMSDQDSDTFNTLNEYLNKIRDPLLRAPRRKQNLVAAGVGRQPVAEGNHLFSEEDSDSSLEDNDVAKIDNRQPREMEERPFVGRGVYRRARIIQESTAYSQLQDDYDLTPEDHELARIHTQVSRHSSTGPSTSGSSSSFLRGSIDSNSSSNEEADEHAQIDTRVSRHSSTGPSTSGSSLSFFRGSIDSSSSLSNEEADEHAQYDGNKRQRTAPL